MRTLKQIIASLPKKQRKAIEKRYQELILPLKRSKLICIKKDKLMTKTKLRNALKLGVVEVTFKKLSTAKERVMMATLCPDFMPKKKTKTLVENKKVNEDICVVYDTEKEDFRSFRYDSVLDARVIK